MQYRYCKHLAGNKDSLSSHYRLAGKAHNTTELRALKEQANASIGITLGLDEVD